MAGASLLMLLDDIAAILDDVSVMTKTAASKTAGVLGDDLALNAQQVTGVLAKRELPVVWAVAKGSLLNKLILVPSALVINAFVPWLVVVLLMMGGLYLCYEGLEKVIHHFSHRRDHSPEAAKESIKKLEAGAVDEKAKIKGAVRTDFVLSAEIIVITLSVVAAQSLTTQILVLSAIAVSMTVGVYGLVALIVKLDDIGLYLSQRSGKGSQKIGRLILQGAPYLMKGLTVVGTAAMFLVGGQILVHGIPALSHGVEAILGKLGHYPEILASLLFNGLFGMIAGALALAVVRGIAKLRKSTS